MAKVKKNTKAAAVDSTAKQTNKEKQNNVNINTQEDNKDSLKSHSMTSQDTKKKETRGQRPVFLKIQDRLDDLINYTTQGIENKKIAELLDISESSFYRLMADNQEFKEAYQKGIDNRKYVLEKALLKRAEGYAAEEIQYVETNSPKDGITKKKTVTQKNYVPDTTALIFALKNLYGDKYKDRVETVTDINVNINQMQQLSNEELAKMVSGNIIEADYRIE